MEEKEYIEYVGVFSLAFLAESLTYFLQPFQSLTYLTLLAIPVLFGFTAYISRDGFRKSSLLSLPSLIFALLGPISAVISVFIAVGNILVSVFAGGEKFRDFYSTTTLPMLFTGLLIGGLCFGILTTQPGVKKDFRNVTASSIGENVEKLVESSNIIGNQKQAQIDAMKQVSEASIAATQVRVLNETDFNRAERMELVNAFTRAQDEVPELIENRTARGFEEAEVDISGTVEDSVKNLMTGAFFLAVIPIITLLVYSLQPLIGLLTAVSAFAFRKAGI